MLTKAFHNLKEAMTRSPVLALPGFPQPFVIECEASGPGLGAVLMQNGKTIADLSHALHGRNLSLPTYEKELLPIIIAVGKWAVLSFR